MLGVFWVGLVEFAPRVAGGYLVTCFRWFKGFGEFVSLWFWVFAIRGGLHGYAWFWCSELWDG